MHNVRAPIWFPAASMGEATMTVYSGPVFEMAVNQFNVIANHLEIPMDGTRRR